MKKIRGLFFIPGHLREEIEGDLLQRFERDFRRSGRSRAKIRLALNIIKFFRPGILFRKNPNKRSRSPLMFRNYFVIAIRNVMAHKTNSSINILSLIVGITSALIMISVIRYELSFDQFHSNANRTYRIYRQNQDGFESRGPGIGYPVPEAFRSEVSALEKITAVQYYIGAQVDVEMNGEKKKFREENGVTFVDQEFFNVFDFHGTGFRWIAGDPNTALTEPFNVVITESMAKKYFGDVNVLGKEMTFEGQLPAKVSGVITDLPVNSDFPFKIIISYSTWYEIEADRKTDWNSINTNHQAFVLLPEGTSASEVEEQFDKVHAVHVSKDMADERKYRLQPLTDMHKDPKLGNFNSRTADETTLWILAVTGLLLLSVGCINYVNIATAQTTLRGREIGVRKVLGGQKKQLILQFLSETFVLVVAACMISLFLAEVLIVNMASLINTVPLQHLFADPFLLTCLGALVLAITVMAGLYPAIVVSAYGIIEALKGKSGGASSAFLRKSLVVVQFAVTQAFLIGAFIVINQLQYSRNLDLGFRKDMILTVAVPQNNASKNEQLRDAVLAMPNISSISLSSSFPSGRARNQWYVGISKIEATDEEVIVTEYQSIDTAFMNLYGIGMVAGRNFVNSDSSGGAIVNEFAAKAIGFKTPEEAVGSPISLDGKDYTIVGVSKNFHSSSTRGEFGPITFVYKPSMFMTSNLTLNVDPSDIPETLARIEKTWTTVYPAMLFDYTFLDDNIDEFYREDRKLGSLLQVFSGVFLVIACLGLYGLLSFVINRRMKEVAVRKVFGAGVMNIVQMISKDYVVLILISFATAVPMSYYFMDQWLEGFKFHIPITWWILMTPGAAALVIAMLTLSGKLLKAASANPAETLKYE